MSGREAFEVGDVIEFPNGARAVLVKRHLAWLSWDVRWQRHEENGKVGTIEEVDELAMVKYCRVIEPIRCKTR